VALRKNAAVENDRTVAAEFETYRAGESSLIDAILSERNQTFAALDLVSARQSLAQLVAQLRFETGTLLGYSAKDGDVVFGEAAPTGLPDAARREQ
jgi:outer membrane protein TolC